MLKRSLGLAIVLTSLAGSTGCGLVSGAMIGALYGDDPQTFDDIDGIDSAAFSMGVDGSSTVCLGTQAELSADELAASEYDLSGTYLGTFEIPDTAEGWDNVVPCAEAPRQRALVRDAQGRTWSIGFAWFMSGWDSTPWPTASEGQAMEVLVRVDRTSGSQAAGFVMSVDGEPLYVLESGRNGRGLGNGDVPGLNFANGDVATTFEGPCGEHQVVSQLFESDRGGALVMMPGEDTGYQVGDNVMTTCSINSWRAADASSCEGGLVAESSFVMFR